MLSKYICSQCGAKWLKKVACSGSGHLPLRLRVRSLGNKSSESRLRQKIVKRGLPNVCKLARRITDLYKRRTGVKLAYKCHSCGTYRVLKRLKFLRSATRNSVAKGNQAANKRLSVSANRSMNDSLNRSNASSRNVSFNGAVNLSSTTPASNKKKRSLAQEMTRMDKQEAAARSRPVSLADFLQSLT